MATLRTGSYHYSMRASEISTTLRYLIPTGERPIYIASRGGADAALKIGAEFEDRDVKIHDARYIDPPASLDREGFTLLPHRTEVANFYQLETYRAVYETELIDLVLGATGGTDALVFDHTLRSDSSQVRGQHATRERKLRAGRLGGLLPHPIYAKCQFEKP